MLCPVVSHPCFLTPGSTEAVSQDESSAAITASSQRREQWSWETGAASISLSFCVCALRAPRQMSEDWGGAALPTLGFSHFLGDKSSRGLSVPIPPP